LRDEGVLQSAIEETQGRFDDDSMWKDIIERYFYPLLERTVPDLYREADTDKPPRYLDKEFRDILNTSDNEIHNSAHYADFLIEVPLRDGQAKWILLHVEVQGQGGGNLPERMFHYMCLIYGHYRRNVVGLALITGRRPVLEKDFYEFKRYGIDLVYRYNKLDVSGIDDEKLPESDNPIDLVFAAAKHALAFPKDDIQKFRYLKRLILLLSERNWSQQDKRDLLRFLDRVTKLRDPAVIAEWVEFQREMNEEGKIVYLSHLEQALSKEITERVTEQITQQVTHEAEERGKLEGIQEVTHDMVMKLLERNFPIGDIVEITGLSEDEIRSLVR